jgi:antitoxin component of MazEF toxin-antitoxin module
MTQELRDLLKIPYAHLDEINALLLDPDERVISDFLAVVEKYGTPEEINAKAEEARKLENLLEMVKETKPEYLDDLKWLEEQRDAGAFIPVKNYRQKVLGTNAETTEFADDFAVTLEVSACQYFPWLITAAKRSISEGKLMPGRFIRVRKMKEQEDDGDLVAFAAAMQIIGATYVETLDTKGTDGSNIHLGGPETITGYFGGIGQPNSHALKWLDEYLYYYTRYGVKQVLNINPGTVFIAYMLHKIGVDNEFKISVFMGNDNPYAAFWTLIGAKLFAREDGTTPLIGFNWGNSINNESMEITAQFRKSLGFEEIVRFEHHITECFKHIIIQPYNRRDELVELADHVANISAKHEGGDPEIDGERAHPSDILDYFRDKSEVIESGDWDALETNFMDKYEALNKTAWALTERGLSFVAADVHK